MVISDYRQEAGRQQLIAATNEATKLSRESLSVDVIRIALRTAGQGDGPRQSLPHELIALLRWRSIATGLQALLQGHQQEKADSLAFTPPSAAW